MTSRTLFIASSAAAAVATQLPRRARAAEAAMPMRALGSTGAMVSIVGMGGFHLGQAKLAEADAISLVHAGVDRGINFMDNCWDYNEGVSETRMGRALAQGGYRDRVFLMTKVDGRTKSAATAQLEDSLARLKTDRIDLWQFHENIRPDDADRIFAPGGAMEAALAAKAAGKIRHIGFTGHKRPAYHLHMFELAAQHGFTFDSVQMPLNVMDAHYDSFEKNVIPVARHAGTAILAMKTFGDPFIVTTGVVTPIDMLHYGMNLPVTTVITGIDSPETLDQAVAAATTFAPMTAQRVAEILAKTEAIARHGSTEMYKTSAHFDGTAAHPEWLG